MSAFQLSSKHLSTMVRSAPFVRNEDEERAFFDALAEENLRSLKARYPSSYKEIVEPVIYDPSVEPVCPGALANLIDCYEYQSCEHAGWSTSLVRMLLASWKPTKYDKMDYDRTPWGI